MDSFKGRILPAGWLVYTTDDGRPYFHCKATDTTQWTEPTPTSAAAGGLTADDEASGDITGARTVTFGKKAGGYATIASESSAIPAGAIDVESGRQPKASDNLFLGFFDLSPIQTYFDVDTNTVKARLLAAMLPYRVVSDAARVARNPEMASELALDNVTSSIRQSPDFYGPFWISTTLMLVLFFGSNAAIYLANSSKSHFETMVVAFFTVYGYLFGVPALALLVTMFSGGSAEKDAVTLRPLVSVYGYSFAMAIPVAVLSTIPLGLLRWCSAGVGFLATLLFLLFNYKTELLEGNTNFRMLLALLFGASQLTFYAAFPLYYFNV